MASVTAFTSIPAVKGYLRIGVSNQQDDGLLRTLVDDANMTIAKALERNILTASYTEVRNGTGTKTLMLKNFPVTAVTSASWVGPTLQTPISTPLVQGQDYTFTAYGLQMYAGVWPRGVANISVVYTAGYANVPGDLAAKAAKLAALRYREIDRLGQKSKILAGETVTFDLSELPPDVEAVIERYKVGMALTDELAGTL